MIVTCKTSKVEATFPAKQGEKQVVEVRAYLAPAGCAHQLKNERSSLTIWGRNGIDSMVMELSCVRRMAVGLLNHQLKQVTANTTMQFPGVDAFAMAGAPVQRSASRAPRALALAA